MASIANLGKKSRRNLYWGFIIYEDSVVPDYIDYLKNEQVAFVLSPWHDKDTWSNADEAKNPEHKAGTLKKKHRHGILLFSSLKTQEQVKEITDEIHALPPQPIRDINRSVQYLIHKNDPEKAQYEKSEIVAYAVDVEEYFLFSPTFLQKRNYFNEMIEWVKANDVVRMNDLIDEALKNHADTWAVIFQESPRWAIEKYINGQWQREQAKKNNNYMPSLGNISALMKLINKAADGE